MAKREPNARLKSARLVMRLSQDAFAERLARLMRDAGLNVAPTGNLVGLWERGETRPGRDYRQGLTALTGLTEFQLGLSDMPPTEEGEDTKRRQLLQTGLVTAGAAVAGLPVSLPAYLPSKGRPGPEHAQALRRLVELHRGWIYEHGSDLTVQFRLGRLLDKCSHYVSDTSGDVRKDFLEVLSEIAGVAGYASRDQGNHGDARQ